MTSSISDTATTLFQSAVKGERRSLGKLLTAIERGGDQAEIIAGLAHQVSGNTHVVGITGAPGSGKSTLINQTLYPQAAKTLNRATKVYPQPHETIEGFEHLDKVV
ncbi:MAG: hypothetical protein VXV73_02160, partial [Actinomycetota bacterium]|nr:hypothetical protein [Actinomycetota bacterium]